MPIAAACCFRRLTFIARADWFGTGTVRLGYLITPSFLIYGKGAGAVIEHASL